MNRIIRRTDVNLIYLQIQTDFVMKRFLRIFAVTAAFMLPLALSAKSGIEVGYLNSTYRSKTTGGDITKSSPMSGFYAGVVQDARIVAGLSIQPGLYYSYLNSAGKEEIPGFNLSRSDTEHMLSIPIHLKYTFDIVPIFNIYVFAGPTLSMGLGATEKLTATGEILGNTVSGSVTYNRYSGSVKSDSEDLNDLLDQYMPEGAMTRFDVLMGGGIGLGLLKFITVKGGFDYGLLNRYKGDLADSATLNRMQFYISLGVRF